MTEKHKSELEGLLVDAQEGDLDRALLAALEGRVALERSGKRLLPRPLLFDLSIRHRLLGLFLAREAMARLDLGEHEAEVEAAVLATESQVPIKTCREYLSRMVSQKLLEKGRQGYRLPRWNVLRALDELKEE
jgi:hypothetical protein